MHVKTTEESKTGYDKTESTQGESFQTALSRHRLSLRRAKTTVLQVNVGLVCNQECKHCHLEAAPDREEVMTRETLEQVAAFAKKGNFKVIDVTGGAPELNPHLMTMLETFSSLAPRVMIRTNLTALNDHDNEPLIAALSRHRVVVVASLPSLDASQMEAQRGAGVWEKSLAALRNLNRIGYGKPGSGLELNLVSNPTGAFLPPSQKQVEARFQSELDRRWGIVFSELYTFANAPLGRFRRWLIQSGNFESYMQKLISSFNPCTVEALMCRTLISVSWDGYLYDCDFNLALGIPAGGIKVHVSEVNGPPINGTPIATSEHCYCCTSGSGFT